MRFTALGLSCLGLLACPSAPPVDSNKPVPSPVLPQLRTRPRTDLLIEAEMLRGDAVWNPQQVSIVAFGASWCEPCWLEWTALSKAALPEPTRVFIVLSEPEGEGRGRVVDWAQRTAPTFTLLADPKGAISDAWKIRDFPGLVVWKQSAVLEHQGYDPEVVPRAIAAIAKP